MNHESIDREAEDEGTPPERLRQIKRAMPPASVLRAIAQNPNCPTDELWDLTSKFAYEVLRNPVLPLLHLEDPNIASKVSATAQGIFSHRRDAPSWLISHVELDQGAYGGTAYSDPLKQHPGHNELGLGRRSEFHKVMWRLAEAKIKRLRLFQYHGLPIFIEMLEGVSIPNWVAGPFLQELEKAMLQENINFQPFMPSQGDTGNENTGTSDEYDMYELVIQRLKLWHQTVLRQAQLERAQAGATQVRVSPLSALPAELDIPEAQEQLSSEALRDERTSPQVLRALASSNMLQILIVVARHVNTPLDVLDALVAHKSSWVRGALARNRQLPQEVIEKLADDKHCVVRANIARHSLTPLLVLEKLADDEDGEVLDALIHRKDLPEEFKSKVAARRKKVKNWGRSRTARQLSKLRQTPVHVLEELAYNPDLVVRSHVAAHRKTPAHIFEKLTRDPEVKVRERMAANPATPHEVLLGLIDEDSSNQYSFYEALASNGSLSADALELLWKKLERKITVGDSRRLWILWQSEGVEPDYQHRDKCDIFDKVRSHPNVTSSLQQKVKQARLMENLLALALSKQATIDPVIALSSPQASVEILDAFLYIREWWCRLAIARNAMTPLELLKKLEDDTDIYVSEWVKKRLLESNA